LELNKVEKFLLHVLPPKFVRIRYYGFLGNTVKKKNLVLIRNMLGDTSKQTDEQEVVPSSWVELMIFLTGEDPTVCKICGIGRMVNVTSVPGAWCPFGEHAKAIFFMYSHLFFLALSWLIYLTCFPLFPSAG
jgi:hypothetical protein